LFGEELDPFRTKPTLRFLAVVGGWAAVLTAARAFAAVDLGADSGRVVLGRLDGGSVSLEVVHRFPNRPVRLPDGLHWNLIGLFADTLEGLGRAAAKAPLSGIGIDSWGVDYGLLDGSSRLLGLPFHYRDERTHGMVARVHERVSRDELYSLTGIQTMALNTIFQLMAEADGPAAREAERIGLVPDLFGLWLTGELANEVTAASTTGLLDARSGGWARSLLARLGLPQAPFAGDPVEPGTLLGPVLGLHSELAGADVSVWTVAGHDTASAFAATPLRGPREAVLSSGTWSLLGLEIPEPMLGADAAELNFTNERGLDGTIRLLRNVMGLWLLQECRRAWTAAGTPWDYEQLHALAAAARPDVALFDPDDDGLLAPGDMPARIVALCRAGGQEPPADAGEIARSILLSLACKYRLVLERLERVAQVSIERVHVVGGGARNALLCQLTADLCGLELLAGPDEATALGNVLIQARAAGDLGGSLAELREVAAASMETVAYEPAGRQQAAETYARFLAVTCLDAEIPRPTVVGS
jgi:rhamnulokinase